MDAHAQMIFDEYLEKRESYEKVLQLASEIINKIISDNNMYVVAIESRLKTAGSLEGKLNLKGYKYNSIFDITDIVGTRIVTFYTDEVDKVAALVEKHFDIDWNESVDKRRLYEDDNSNRFGYMSLHYIASIPKSYYYDEAHPEINKIRFEIQMRTALQHIWATSAHDTGYKSDIEIPKKYIRSLSRLAGLLELADEEFSVMLKDITEYRRKVRKLVSDGSFDELQLDGDTFRSYIAIDPFKELKNRIAAINRSEITDGNPSVYFEILKYMNFKTIGDIERMRKDYSEMAYQLALSQLAETDIDILSSTIGLKNLCLAYIYSQGSGVKEFRDFYDIVNGPKPYNAKTAERTMKALEQIGKL